MDGFLLSDWITIRTGEGASSVVQSENTWLDLSAYEDVQWYLDVRELTGTVGMSYETSPTRQDSSFVSMLSFVMSTGVRVDRAPFTMSLVPLARFLRWRLTTAGIGVSDATFRVWVAAYSYG